MALSTPETEKADIIALKIEHYYISVYPKIQKGQTTSDREDEQFEYHN